MSQSQSRDFSHLGLPKPNSSYFLDVYDTLSEKAFSMASNNLVELLCDSHVLIRNVYNSKLANFRSDGMSPPVWSIGHVAYMNELIVLLSMGYNIHGDILYTCNFYDSIRIDLNERYI